MALLLRTPFRATALADAGRNCSSGGSYELPSSRSVKKKKLSAARLSSSSNPFVKHCVKLRLSSSYRRSQGSALVVGLTPIMEVCRFWQLNSGELSNIECLLLLDGMEIPEMLNLPSISIVHVSLHVIKKLSGVQSVDSTEAVALIKIPRSFYDMLGEHKEEIYPSWFPLPNRLLVLDGIQDPGNLGTLLRSSMAFRWDVPVVQQTHCHIPRATSPRIAALDSVRLVPSTKTKCSDPPPSSWELASLKNKPPSYSVGGPSPSFLARPASGAVWCHNCVMFTIISRKFSCHS